MKSLIRLLMAVFVQCNVLLPAVATLLHATPQEYSALRGAIQIQGNWWPQTA